MEHGVKAYKYGCRCWECVYARSVRDAYIRRMRRAGEWIPLVDAAPVREHVVKLISDTGVTLAELSRISGVNKDVIRQLIKSDPSRRLTEKIRPWSSETLLSVTAEQCSGLETLRNVDATGARRRVEALMYMGWSMGRLGAMVGRSWYYSQVFLQPRIQKKTDDLVRGLYAELWDKIPTNDRNGSVTRTRAMALKKGYLPPQAWDDDTIDDPEAKPSTGAVKRDMETVDWVLVDRVVEGDGKLRDLNRPEKAEVVRILRDRGESVTAISRHLKMNGTQARVMVDREEKVSV